ncbi:hypothetical protein [Klebsiella aerogenes]|uniref:hypothetical protein n=1 Tax=Klebsiella aerogenes TaxID=548 RepID=UPI00351D2352
MSTVVRSVQFSENGCEYPTLRNNYCKSVIIVVLPEKAPVFTVEDELSLLLTVNEEVAFSATEIVELVEPLEKVRFALPPLLRLIVGELKLIFTEALPPVQLILPVPDFVLPLNAAGPMFP